MYEIKIFIISASVTLRFTSLLSQIILKNILKQLHVSLHLNRILYFNFLQYKTVSSLP